MPDASRVAVIDLGSNSFRLVVFSSIAGRWWRRTDEIYEPVRIGAGEGETGALQAAPMERALHTHLAKRLVYQDDQGRSRLVDLTALELVQSTRRGVGKIPPAENAGPVPLIPLDVTTLEEAVDGNG